jgi:uncharacterized protein YcaQ
MLKSETLEFMQTLDRDSVNLYLLFKHHLLDGSQTRNVLHVVDDIIALHATSAVTPYLSLFARVKNFKKEHLDLELYKNRNLIRLEAMRRTLFITSTDLAPILYQATKTPESYRLKRLQRWGIEKPEYEKLSKELYDTLKKGRKTFPEIEKALPKETARSVQLRVGKARYEGTNIKIALSSMMRDGIVLSEKDRGTLSKSDTRANMYMLFEEAYPNLDLNSITGEEARASLLQRYIRSFGPVANEDILWWTGFTKTDLERALRATEDQLSLVKIPGLDKDYWMLRTDYRKYRMFRALKGKSVILLPYEDPYTKGYWARDRLVDADHEREVYLGGEVQPAILSNGKIVGTWTRSLIDSKPVRLIFFEKPERAVERKASKKAKAMAKLISGSEHEVQVKVEP